MPIVVSALHGSGVNTSGTCGGPVEVPVVVAVADVIAFGCPARGEEEPEHAASISAAIASVNVSGRTPPVFRHGAYVEIESTYSANGAKPPLQMHPSQTVARDNEWTPNPMQLFEAVSRFGDEFCLC